MSEIRAKLDENIPREAVSQRKAGGGISLSYLEGWYVIDRLNKVFGQGNWQYETVKIEKTAEREVFNAAGKSGRGVAFLATVQLTVDIDEQVVQFTDVGAGTGIDYGNGLTADESAAKEAVTDALKRCAKNLGMSMGLALYDKTQEYVDDGNTNTKKTEQNDRPTSAQSNSTSKVNSQSAKSEKSTTVVNKRPTKDIVKGAYEVLKQLQKVTAESFKKEYLSGGKLAEISDEQAESVLNKIKTTYPELGL